MLYLVSYDVVQDTHRRRVFESLKDFGARVQDSVFECQLDEPALQQLATRLEPEIDEETDSCRIYPLCETCYGKLHIFGRGEPYRRIEYIIV